jgi:phosphate transport system substrate-binding protein
MIPHDKFKNISGGTDMKRLITSCMLLLTLAALTMPGSALAAGSITIAGDPCSLPLAMKLADAYSRKDKTFKAEKKQVGCMLGVYQAANGDADIGVSTQNGLTSNLPRDGKNMILAKAPIVLVVNRDNRVNNLSYDQLQDIYSGKIKNWKEVGGSDLEIKNVMLEPCVKHTMSKKVAPYSDDISRLTPGEKVNPVTHTNKMVSEDKGAIGQQLYGYETDHVKVLSIDGVFPTEETVPGKYSFYEEYNFVTQGEPTGIIREFLRFALSDEGREIIRSLKHIPAN